jgi:SAM-dependent methyltransferase
VALDISEERVQWQRSKAAQVLGPGTDKILPVVASATALPFQDGAFMRATSISALEHVPDDRGAAAELGRVLREGGLAVISVAYTFRERNHLFRGVKRFQEVEKNRWVQVNKNGYQIRFYTDDDLRTRFAAPAHARIEKVGYFGRKIIDGWYHQTWLNRYWFSYILKDFLLVLTLYAFEERFLRSTEPFNVIFRMRKGKMSEKEGH